MADTTDRYYEFGKYRIDVGKRLLYRDGVLVPLTPKVFDTLLVLVENKGRTVEKSELMDLLWQDSFVEESNLAENIRKLRRALDESPGENRFIMTVPRGGYRFVSDVREIDPDEVETVVSEVTRSRVRLSRSGRLGQELPATDIPIRADGPILLDGKRRGNGRFWFAVVCIAVLVAATAIFYIAVMRRPSPVFSKFKLTRLTTTGKIVTAAISPDGNNIVYAAGESGLRGLWLTQTGGVSNPINIVEPGPAEILGAVFSPDGKYVYYLLARLNETNNLFRVPSLGGAPVNVINDVDSIVSFSPDGKQLVFVRGYAKNIGSGLIIADCDGSNERPLAVIDQSYRTSPVSDAPSWSPDGKHIAVPVRDGSDAVTASYTVSEVAVADGSVRQLTDKHWQQASQVLWLPKGDALAVIAAETDAAFSNQVWLINYPDGKARQLTNDLNDYRYITVTADGKNIAAVQTDEQANIFTAPVTAPSQVLQITSTNYDGTGGLAWTRTGDIVYSARSGSGQNLWRVTAEGKHTQQLTDTDNLNYAPAVSPDGRTIAFVSTRSGGHHIWCMDADGAHPRQLTNGIVERAPVFSADGSTVFFRSFRAGGGSGISRIPLAGGEPAIVTDAITGLPAISPDGTQIACFYRASPTTPLKLAILSTGGGSPVQLFDMPIPTTISWMRDGKGIAYDGTLNGISNIFVQPLSGGDPVRLTDYSSGIIYGFAWSPDGKELAIARGKITSDVVMISALP